MSKWIPGEDSGCQAPGMNDPGPDGTGGIGPTDPIGLGNCNPGHWESYVLPEIIYTTSFPIQDEVLGEIDEPDQFINIANIDLSQAYFDTFDINNDVYTFNNFSPSDSYPDSHPVSIAIKNYNKYIWLAFKGANNTSIK